MIEFNRFIDISENYCSLIDPAKLHSNSCPGKRSTISSESFSHLSSFSFSFPTIEAGSSDEEPETDRIFPSTSKVISRIIDTSSLILSDTYQPAHHSPCFLVSPISPSIKESQISSFLKKSSLNLQQVQIVDLNTQYGKAAFLWFYNEDESKDAWNKFLNGDFWNVEVFDNARFLKWVDYRVLNKEAKFYAVVIRGFSKELKSKDLKVWLGVKFDRCEIRVVGGIACGVFVLKDALDVCCMCRKYNFRKDLFGNVVRVHAHFLTLLKHSNEIFEVLNALGNDEGVRERSDGKEGKKVSQFPRADPFRSLSNLKD
jgi:hypothetical protein